MRRRHALLPLLVFAGMFSAARLDAQNFDLAGHAELLGDLSRAQWRFHTGDDPDGKLGWASPSFDDSRWPLLQGDRGWAEQGFAHYHGFAWYRLHIHLPAAGLSLALSPVHIDNAYRLYLDGQLLGGVGEFGPLAALIHRPYDFYRAEARSQDIVVAIRVYSFAWGAPYGVGGFHRPTDTLYGFSAPSGFLIGSPQLVDQLNGYRILLITEQSTADIAVAFLIFAAGVISLYLWRRQRTSREYLLFGLTCVCAPWTQALVYALFPNLQINVRDLSIGTDIVYLGLFSASFLFIFALVRRPLGRFARLALAVGCILTVLRIIGPVSQAFGYDWLPPAGNRLLNGIAILLFYGCTMTVLFRNWHLVEARRIAFPWILRAISGVGLFLIGFTYTAGWQHKLSSIPDLISWPFPVTLGHVSLLVFLPITGWILLDRFAEVSDRDASQRSEVEAAQRVQSILLRPLEPLNSDWSIDAVYRAAAEVGGDFYHIAHLPNVSIRVVLGDVSGKGMGAAMLVSALIGALDILRRECAPPEEVLAKLNTMLVEKQHGGFTTCICLELGPGGAVAIANAGHLPPYWNGKEQSLDHGFPLGLLPQAQYAASVLQLAPRDRLTLCTDGIPEARIPQGELFGFDRTAAVSHLGAEEIARSAQQFGQEDDITVVTLTFALAEVLHA